MDRMADAQEHPRTSSPESVPLAHPPEGPWRRASRATGLLRGTAPTPTVFETMTGWAREHDAVNLGQGFPDHDGPAWVRQIAAQAMLTEPTSGAASLNQYAPGTGLPSLRAAVGHHLERHRGLQLDPDREILITTGATEGIAAALLALVSPGDEVVVFEPFYDSYAAMIALAGAVQVTVPLSAPDFQPDPLALESVVTERTRMVVLNTPHNPTGAVLARGVLDQLIQVCSRHDLLVLSDEVYEHLVYDGEHHAVASTPGAWERTITVSSAGKSLSLTGWKVGWLTGPAELVSAVRAVKQFLTYSSGPAYQEAVAEALLNDRGFLADQRDRFRSTRDLLVDGLRQAGLDPVVPAAGYFTVVDLAPWGVQDAAHAVRELTVQAGVTGIPVSSLCRPDQPGPLHSWVRLAFCKRPEVLQEAVRRLGAAADLAQDGAFAQPTR